MNKRIMGFSFALNAFDIFFLMFFFSGLSSCFWNRYLYENIQNPLPFLIVCSVIGIPFMRMIRKSFFLKRRRLISIEKQRVKKKLKLFQRFLSNLIPVLIILIILGEILEIRLSPITVKLNLDYWRLPDDKKDKIITIAVIFLALLFNVSKWILQSLCSRINDNNKKCRLKKK